MHHFHRTAHRQRRVAAQRFQGCNGEFGFFGLKRTQNVAQRFAAKMFVDLGLLPFQAPLVRGLGSLINQGPVTAVGQRLCQRGPVGFGDVVIGKARINRIIRPQPCAGGADVFAQPSGRTGQDQRATHIRHQTDAAFRHGDLAAFADNPVAAVTPHTNPATHGKPLHQAGHGFGKFEQFGVHPVFVTPEPAPVFIIAAFAAGIHFGNIPAGAKGPIPSRINQQHFNTVIRAPRIQRLFNL